MQSTSAVTPNIHQDLWISRVKSLPYRNIHTAGPENETQDGHVASVFSISFTSDGQHVFRAPGLEDRIGCVGHMYQKNEEWLIQRQHANVICMPSL